MCIFIMYEIFIAPFGASMAVQVSVSRCPRIHHKGVGEGAQPQTLHLLHQLSQVVPATSEPFCIATLIFV
jgi:hypothetical protein